jgi:phosphoribosylaminoimidazole-succinocarboxamide synthase
MRTAVTDTAALGLKPTYRGKVRDIFDLGDTLLIVATDRISAYDTVLPTPIPGKGVLLTQITLAWYRYFGDRLDHHLVTAEVDEFPEPYRGREELRGRSMLVRKAQRYDVECVVRGYLAGSGWREYRQSGSVCGIPLPEGLREADPLPEPIFTPATKAAAGHDENIDFERMCRIVPREVAEELRDRSLAIYREAQRYAWDRGIVLADTKFEFGRIGDRVVLIDELLSPDSSRFWPRESYEPGRPQPSFDKQFVRDYLDEIGWDHNPPAPALPEEVVERTLDRYREALHRLFPDAKVEGL